jgi:hypothetical protein
LEATLMVTTERRSGQDEQELERRLEETKERLLVEWLARHPCCGEIAFEAYVWPELRQMLLSQARSTTYDG